MNMRDWALVAFTLLMQASVGILLVVSVVPLFSGRQAAAPASRMAVPVVMAGIAAAAALVISLLHLGHPLQAWLALANVRQSWLSREVVLALAFVVAAALFARTHLHGAAPALSVLATAATVVTGIALVFAMARVYMIAGQPAWNRLATPAGFFATTALLGLVAVLTMAAPLLAPRAARLLSVAALAMLAVQVLLVPAVLTAVAGEPSAAISAASAGQLATWLAAGRIVAAVIAAFLLVALLRSGADPHAANATRVAVLVLVSLSELLGRALFYAAAVRL